jgi:hypothetical protein
MINSSNNALALLARVLPVVVVAIVVVVVVRHLPRAS